jgi:hypothetical protein
VPGNILRLAALVVLVIKSGSVYSDLFRPPLPPGACMDLVHSGQVCGDMVDRCQRKLAGYEPYALACEKPYSYTI